MATVILTKWGNSVGIRIPVAVMKEAHLNPGEKLKIIVNKKGGVTLMPIKNPQAGWLEAFNAVADCDKEKLLVNVANKFDEDEWTW